MLDSLITRANLARQVTFFSKTAFGKCSKFGEYHKYFGDCEFDEYSTKAWRVFQVWQVKKNSQHLTFLQVLAFTKFDKYVTLYKPRIIHYFVLMYLSKQQQFGYMLKHHRCLILICQDNNNLVTC